VKCKICNRESADRNLCQWHYKANTKVFLGYETWRKGLRIPWEDYLRRIRDNSLTGRWAKEVAEYLINKEENGNV
jgi:hypothetical protein